MFCTHGGDPHPFPKNAHSSTDGAKRHQGKSKGKKNKKTGVWERRNCSPNGSIHRTFRATFEMPDAPFNHNLIKTGGRQYRNPIFLAREWRKALDNGEYASPAALAHHLKVSRARVTQILNLLKLSPEVIEMISSLGDPLRSPIVAERRLRLLLAQPSEQQKDIIKGMCLRFWASL